jgi:tRNA(Ile)-lysidine synthase
LNTTEIINTVYDVLCKYTNLDGAVINAAFSGGADSTALLCALIDIRKRNSFTLRALHVNYNLRGEESIRDRDFCRNFCDVNGITFECLETNANNLSDKSENALRDIRYNWFEGFPGFTLTAHTADDNAETFLQNIIRGTGLSGLTAIPEKRGNFIRPLLTVKKNELLDMLYTLGENYITDSSNFTNDYTRNKIRNRIIPEIEKINVSFLDASIRLIASLKTDNDFFEKTAAEYENIANAPKALRLRKLRNFFSDNNLSPDYNKINRLNSAIEEGKTGKIAVGKRRYAVFSPKTGELKLSTVKVYENTENVLTPCETLFFCDKQISASLQKIENLSETEIVHIKLTQNAFDYDIINGIILAGLRKNGDSYKRANRDFESRLKKLYNDDLSDSQKPNNIVLRDDDGIIWCENFGCADRVKITGKTKTIIIIKIAAAY